MAAFSDTTIKERFAELIEGGDTARAGGCQYYFLPGKLNPMGIDANGGGLPVIDWTTKQPSQWPAETAFAMLPGSLLTLRTRERVRMPADCCGLWYQTDSLSRNGVMLVNMSIVPPGYQGPLTCTFVNFGKKTLAIKPNTLIAKLIFLPLDRAANRQSSARDDHNYDSNLADSARESPSTFLQISDQMKALKDLIETGKVNLEKLAKMTSDEFALEAKNAADKYRDDLKSDLVKNIWKALPVAFFAITLLAGAQWIAMNFLTANVEKVAKERADQIEATINKQLEAVGGKPVIVYSGSNETKVLINRIESLESEVKRLRAKKQ